MVIIPFTRREFKDAKSGRIVKKRFQVNGDNYCVIATNKFVDIKGTLPLIEKGFNILPLDVSGLFWDDLDRCSRFNIITEYENGIQLGIISQSMCHRIERENGKENLKEFENVCQK